MHDELTLADAVARYAGPVTICPPGKRSKTVRERPPDPRNEAGWQRDAEAEAEARRLRRRQREAKRHRIAERNAAVWERLHPRRKRP